MGWVFMGMISARKKETIAKSNRLNELRPNEMKLQELRLLNIYLSKINPLDKKSSFVRFPVGDFQIIMDLGRVDINHMKKTTERLLRNVVTIWDERTGGYSQFQLFKWCEVNQDEGGEWFVEFDANDRALPFMFELKSHYFRYELWNTLSLKSPNQLRMYEILKQYEKAGNRTIGIKELREMIGINANEYPAYKDFKKYVLDACKKALSEKTDISFNYEVNKRSGRGGKIQSLKFTIIKNENYKDPINLERFIDLHTVEQYRDSLENEYLKDTENNSERIDSIKAATITTLIPSVSSIDPDVIEDLTEIEHYSNFSNFWDSYPKKKAGKKTAMEFWGQLPRSSHLFNEIMNGLERAKRSQDWTNEGGRFILAPTRWLKEERWEDDFNDYYYDSNKGAVEHKKSRFHNYKGRKWDYEELARLEKEFLVKKMAE